MKSFRAVFALSLAAVSLLASSPFFPAGAVNLEQIVSRENPLYNNRDAELTVGRDGQVYLHSHVLYNGYVTRVTTQGTEKTGYDTGPATGNIAVNAAGVLAAANEHFTHSVGLYDANFKRFAQISDFVMFNTEFGEASGYRSPSRVEVGASGDFYALDSFQDQVVRISPTGSIVKRYAIPRDGKGFPGLTWDFRVSEKNAAFYVRSGPGGRLRAIGFDGAERWKLVIDASGGYDVDDNGVLYTSGSRRSIIQKVMPDGGPPTDLELSGQIPNQDGTKADFRASLATYPIASMRVWKDEIFLKRAHPTERFLRFGLADGQLRGATAADFERLTVTYPSETWTSGDDVDFAINLTDVQHHATPRWHVWARGLSTPDYQEFPVEGGKLKVPAGAAGLYQIKVTPEVQPWLRGTPSEYLLQSWIEVRARGSHGSANVFTPANRAYFARGEEVPFSVLLRGGADVKDKSLQVDVSLRAEGGQTALAVAKTTAKGGEVLPMSLGSALTAALAPGRYVVSASSSGLTSVSQPLVIGPATIGTNGANGSGWLNVLYGDYEQPGFFPSGADSTAWTEPDLASAHVQRLNRLGVNMVVERVGHSTGEVTTEALSGQLDPLRVRLTADAAAAAPEKAAIANALKQTMAGLGANGMSQMSILLYMDSALPVGKGNDTVEKTNQRIGDVTSGLKGFPAFRGWSWVANWWIWNRDGLYSTPDEKTAYTAALKVAQDSGTWSDVLDTIGNRRFAFGVDAEKQFHGQLNTLAPGKVSALAGPYRSIDVYPPLSFASADEVDLHYQAEQIQPPDTVWHNVDYQKRPGKKAWGHPELWNDNGTGGQLLPSLFGMAMRGADGVGLSGHVPNWGRQPEDVRSAYYGTASVLRAAFHLFKDYGPWMRTLQNDDRVAVVVSGRMAKIDNWKGVGGEYFTRLFEAYQACLYAHRPASFVFAEDLKPDSLQAYKAVLVVGQTVQFEAPLAAALQNAKAKGVLVLCDATCRPALVKDFVPLNLGFDTVVNDARVWQDDSSQWRFADCFVNDAVVVSKALATVAPAAVTAAPQVLLTERRAENGRYLWVLNNTVPRREPGSLWRVAKALTNREPMQAAVKLNTGPGSAVYDVFAMKRISAPAGQVTADLRTLPARLYAILPAPIDRVALRGPATVAPGQSFKWWLQPRDGADQPILASVPVRLRLTAGGQVLEERQIACGGAGLAGSMTLPLNAAGAQLEATELLTGTKTVLALKIAPAALPLNLPLAGANPADVAPAAASASGVKVATPAEAPDAQFGYRARDLAVSGDGNTALVTAMNWDQNAFGLDVATGKVKWSDRVGQHFAYAPQSIGGGFALQGFDFDSAQGYGLYLAGTDGKASRRFALDGLPKGSANWAMGGILQDRPGSFAPAPDGGWVASAGDLGLAVWDASGKLLWSQDWRDRRPSGVTLTALGNATVVVTEGMNATAYNSATGAKLWQMTLASNGDVLDGRASRDGGTLVLRSTADSGRVFVLRAGKIVANILTKAEDVALTSNGDTLALSNANVLKVYDVASGLKWSYAGDDSLHFPRFSPDDKRIAIASELGTVTVMSTDGTRLYEADWNALAAPAWLPGGDLLLANWNGNVTRVNSHYDTVWQTHLTPGAGSGGSSAAEVPTSRLDNWTNADPAAPTETLSPNLLTQTKAIFTICLTDRPLVLQNKAETICDGLTTAPAQPWITWSDVNMIDSGWAGQLSLVFDTFRTQLHVTGLTFVEDATHPESWLRDVNLEYWDARQEKWIFAANLLSNSAVHTHTLAHPIDAAKFRLVKSPAAGTWPVGNVRLSEIVFHGDALGASHPDAVAKKNQIVLFDEGNDLKPAMINVDYKLDGAYSGGRSLQVAPAKPGLPQYTPPFGHALPNWNFPIRENPGPGEYRWLQFAWKALSPQTSGMSLLLGSPWPGGGVSVVAGQHNWGQGVTVEKKVPGGPPEEWQTVRVDLFATLKKPIDIQMLGLGSTGGGAAYDQIVLGKTEADLPPMAAAATTAPAGP